MTTITQYFVPQSQEYTTIQCNYPLSNKVSFYSVLPEFIGGLFKDNPHVIAIWKCKSFKQKITENDPA